MDNLSFCANFICIKRFEMNVIKMISKGIKSILIGKKIDSADCKLKIILCYDNLFINIFHIYISYHKFLNHHIGIPYGYNEDSKK